MDEDKEVLAASLNAPSLDPHSFSPILTIVSAVYLNIRLLADGTRCPLSSSLFIICIEYLSHYIQSNKHIKGISLEPDEEIKQSLFADDATYFVNDSSDSFDNLIESLTLFGTASGLKLNKSKCTVLR
ncbi:hypothetical protein DPMN_052593 [Dreissena polymorpha]|uniref:Reverse transcriptase domain-containing protein n=1 Tax=Dreissena polymorpha TaxID=45954 RepID=A0A9D4CJZ3_DREPO|nr:hypothetical protein DPMN_052593 [Dreissena polymorpha]